MPEGAGAERESGRVLPQDTGKTLPEEFAVKVGPAPNVLSDSFTVSDTTNGWKYDFAKVWKRPARFVRLQLNQSAVVKYKLQPQGNFLTYPGGLSANRWLRMNETVYYIIIIPSSSATLNIMASSGAAFVEED